MTFFQQQPKEQNNSYKQLLKSVGALSNLFSDSDKPFLYYRAHENAFCRAFQADNQARSDISFDATKDGCGIGLKTFVVGNGAKLEKIAEFNKDRNQFSQYAKNAKKMVEVIAELRNHRLEQTKNICDTDSMIYHCVARAKGKFYLHEEEMNYVDVSNIEIIPNNNDRTVKFFDGLHEYSFNISKSTLFKKFDVSRDSVIPVKVLADPFDAILEYVQMAEIEAGTESVILPLYSYKKNIDNNVAERSGLNQWNARGRKRNAYEVYIAIPAWIHQKFEDFFPERDAPFTLILPNGKKMSSKVCQDGSKALMSNPNTDLGKWLLNTVFNVANGHVMTYEDLQKAGIDSVEITKHNENTFSIDFRGLGSYEKFIELYNNE